MWSKKDLNSPELDTARVSESPTTVVTANGEVQTKEEATVYVKELDLFVTIKLLEETPAVLTLGKLCEDHGFNHHHWTSGQKPHLIKKGRRIKCNTANHVPIVVPGLSTRRIPSSATPTSPTSVLQEAVVPTQHPASTRSESRKSTVRVSPSKKQTNMEKTRPHGETRCAMCQNGQKNLRRIFWMKAFQLQGTHPGLLLLNQLQGRE